MREEGYDSWDTLAKAIGFQNVLNSGLFVAPFVTARKGLQYIKPLTVKLQTKTQDATFTHQHIRDVTTCLQNFRDEAEATFLDWFEEACNIAVVSRFDVQKPRTCSKQTLRDNHCTESAEDYFRVSVFVPFLDILLQHLTTRFQNFMMALAGHDLIPFQLIEKAKPGLQKLPDSINELTALWKDDLPTPRELESELNRWVERWHRGQKQPSNNSKGLIARV